MKWTQKLLPWLGVLAVGGIAAWLRYGLVEPAELAHHCDTSHTALCMLRDAVVFGFSAGNPLLLHERIGLYGWAALAAALLALVWRAPFAAWLAASAGLFALVLYGGVPGALALLIGCLRLVRLQARAIAPR